MLDAAPNRIEGLSTDRKPATATPGSVFDERDTGVRWVWDKNAPNITTGVSGAWVQSSRFTTQLQKDADEKEFRVAVLTLLTEIRDALTMRG